MAVHVRSLDELVILKMMGLGFIDIRADEKREKTYIISDLYHNIPGALAHGIDATSLLKDIYARAERHGVCKYVANAEKWARDALEKA